VNTPSKSNFSSPSSSYKPSSSIDDLKDTASSAVDSIRDTVGDAVDRGQAAVSQAGATASDIADSAQQQITTFASELSKMARQNPLGALAGAAIAGLLVGLLARGASRD
jgi:ElaB/YqjD/DUF883 family membrane-anchored ribosome-binding protein